MDQGIATVFGGGQVGPERSYHDEKMVKELIDTLAAHGVKEIDTAYFYDGSEELLGKAHAGSRLTIHTKVPGGLTPGHLTKDEITKGLEESLKRLNMKKVDIFFIHAPDPKSPLPEALEGINAAYNAGHFARFGLSNYMPEDVQAIYDHCKQKGYVLPSVYQGLYSAVSRKPDTVLFPTLRKLGIAYYAYSPVAGGFLTKTKQEVLDGAGRMDPSTSVGGLYNKLYNKPAYLDALAQWEQIANDAGCSRADLANRWVKYNSPLKKEHGDALIIGARSQDMLKETLKGLQAGPLSDEVTKRIDGIWKLVEHEALLDVMNG